jgi:hypothetical protein
MNKTALYAALYGAGDAKLADILCPPGTDPATRFFAVSFLRYQINRMQG